MLKTWKRVGVVLSATLLLVAITTTKAPTTEAHTILDSLPRPVAGAVSAPSVRLPDQPPLFVKFYYGDPVDVDHQQSPDHSVDVLSHFDLLVIREPGELDEAQMAVVRRLLNKGRQIYCYTHLAITLAPKTDGEIQAVIDRCGAAGYTGVFFDTAGYDYQVSRARFNRHVRYAHDQALQVMANAWFPADVLASRIDREMNPDGSASVLGQGDWVLLESFYARSDDMYAGETGGMSETMDRYIEAVRLAKSRGVKVLSLSYHNTMIPLLDLHDQETSYVLSLLLGLDGWAYGRSDPDNDRVSWLTKPDFTTGAGNLSDIRQAGTSPLRWERLTKHGLIWFEATDHPASRKAGVELRGYKPTYKRETSPGWRGLSSLGRPMQPYGSTGRT
jgi:hypothetical protein